MKILTNSEVPHLSSGKGFTLLELMISITLIGIITLIVAGAMRLGYRSVDAGEGKIESLERMRVSLTLINCQIQSEIPLTIDEDGSRKYYFKGEKGILLFPSNFSLWGGQTGYVVVTYSVIPDARGKQTLWISESTVGVGNKNEARLFESLDEISFQYFYKGPTDEQGSWVEQWTDDTDIPEKVKVHLMQGTRELSLIIPMRTRGSLARQPSVQGEKLL
ncbi:MAG TPA: prepilin-type N-terminal cleavage/methylation domain-containing protein [Thermodesulfovibrionales bacterium]|nr:prepilin-type N-terminal cleavage/methylation domain-containing protein [Thermodesulfovibrionales bacterium]